MEQEARERIALIEYYLPTLTTTQLRLVVGFIRGIKKNQGN